MKRRWKGGLRYAALVALALCVVLLGALFPGYYVRYRDTLYLGRLRQDEGEQSSYNYQGALRNRADTLEKWLSASTKIAVDLQDVDDDGLSYLDELERNLLCGYPSAPLSGQRAVLEHLSYPSAVNILRFEGGNTRFYVDERSGKVLRFQGPLPAWLRDSAQDSAALIEVLPNLANSYAQYLGLGTSTDTLGYSQAYGLYQNELLQMRFTTDQKLVISILVAPELDMVYIKLESEDGT